VARYAFGRSDLRVLLAVAALVAVLGGMALVLAACSPAPPAPVDPANTAVPTTPATPTQPKEVTVTEADNGKTRQLAPGDTLIVMLKGNPTTGYTWSTTGTVPAFLKQEGEPQFSADSTLVGAPGVMVTRFRVTATGKESLKMVYARPFEKNVKPAATFSVQLDSAK
jgi:inhibitor of cysteine peptidase